MSFFPFFKRKKNTITNQTPAKAVALELTADLSVNLSAIQEALGHSSDIGIRQFTMGQAKDIHVAIVYISSMVDNAMINDFVLRSLMLGASNDDESSLTKRPFDVIRERCLAIGQVQLSANLEQMLTSLLSGKTVILVDGYGKGISCNTTSTVGRSIEEPQSQTVVRGPREGFNENIRTNVTLIRRKIKSPNLRYESMKIGRVTQTDVGMMYLKGIADDGVINEIKDRLNSIDVDSILESGYIEEYIQDQTFTPFPTIYNSERPDAIAAGILEGQIAILIDGTPFVLLAPATFIKFFQASEDYYQRWDISSFLRILRLGSFIIAMLLPSIYIAITTYHQEMLPTTLLISLAAQREGVPFPAFVEALMMELVFEVLREAGVRMPRAVGQAVSIVGALVIGQAAVQAGLVSAGMVIIVSFTAISNFVAPAFNLAIAARLLRFFLMVLAATLGLFGIMAGLIALLIHMTSLRSFGVPYLSPITPFNAKDQQDVFVRFPMWAMNTRPSMMATKNQNRQAKNMEPKPPEEEKDNKKSQDEKNDEEN